MKRSEIKTVQRAIELLHRLLPPGPSPSSALAPSTNPVMLFVQNYLVREPASDLSTAELWCFYREVAAAGELPPLARQAFQTALPAAMGAVLGVKKCHRLNRDGHNVRGFKGVELRGVALPPTGAD